jgi:predicted O-methyltransferase YrrM
MGVNVEQEIQKLLKDIFNRKALYNSEGKLFSLNSNVDQEEGTFLTSLIKNNSFKKTIEIGCAFGISSLYICSALPAGTGTHVIIDPYQKTDWYSVGIAQLEKVGFDNYELIEKGSEIALPELLTKGETFDFVFIDGWHTFDHTLLDMYYLNRMLKVGGIMVIDDVSMKSVNKAVNYFSNYPAYEFEGGVKLKDNNKRILFQKFIVPSLRSITKIVPPRVREEFLSDQLKYNMITGYSMVALRKVKEDERPWNWYTSF